MATVKVNEIAERIYRLKQEVALQSVQDDEFRASLMQDPKAALAEEYGLDVSFFDNINVRITVEEPGEVVLLIPAKSVQDELTDEQLEAVAGGAAFIAGVAAGAAVVSAVAAVGAVGVGVGTIVQATRAGRRW
ncbi:MAG: NHLP leader peptide family RiPP precursor [Gammaproteobacteria bacterium]